MKHKTLTKTGTLLILLLLIPSVQAFDTNSADYSSNQTFINYGDVEASDSEYNLTGIISHMGFVEMQSSDYENIINLIDIEIIIPEQPAPPPEEPGVSRPRGPIINLTLDKDFIRVDVAQGQTISEKLKIKNVGDGKITVNFEVEDVEDFLYFSEDEIEIEKNEEKEIVITISTKDDTKPEVYTGRIIVKAGSFKKIIIVIIGVKEKEALFDVSVILPEEFKKTKGGRDITADIVLYNFGTLMPVDVTLTYEIRDVDGNVIDSRKETLAVEEQLFLQRTFTIPEYLEEGYYLFYVRLDYENQTATGSDMFMILEKEEFGILEILLTYWQILAGTLIGLGGGAFFLRRRRRTEELQPEFFEGEETTDEEKQEIKKILEEAKIIEERKWKELEEKHKEKPIKSELGALREFAKGKITKNRDELRTEKEKGRRLLMLLDEQFEEGKLSREAYDILREKTEQKIREIKEKLAG